MTGAVRIGSLALIATGYVFIASAAHADLVGPPLPDPHVGVPVAAPPPPDVNGQQPDFVQRRWERCRRYAVLVNADRPSTVQHLDFDVADGALTGTISGARRFDGADDSLAVGGAPDVSGTRPYTLELWARPPDRAPDTSYQFMISRETTTASGRQGTGLWFSRAGVGFERWTNGVKKGVTYTPRITNTLWSSVVGTYDGATMRLYIDGHLIGSRPATAPLAQPTGPFVLGAGAGGSSGFFAGDLDELALYDHAVTRSHVAAHVTAARTAPCSTIPGAEGATYTPIVDDLGDTLRVSTNSVRGEPPVTVASVSESVNGVDDAGLLVKPVILTPAAGATVTGTVQLTAAVLGLPPNRIEFLVDGVVRYAKVGEAPYQYTWDTRAASEGLHTVAVRVFGPGSQTAAVAQRTVTVAQAVSAN
jgi:hypothetical protein